MKNMLKSLLLMAAVLVSMRMTAQNSENPQGSLTYCLPMTTVSMEVTAVQENFYAGPYAKYAEKYLGINVRSTDASTFTITEINEKLYENYIILHSH